MLSLFPVPIIPFVSPRVVSKRGDAELFHQNFLDVVLGYSLTVESRREGRSAYILPFTFLSVSPSRRRISGPVFLLSAGRWSISRQ